MNVDTACHYKQKLFDSLKMSKIKCLLIFLRAVIKNLVFKRPFVLSHVVTNKCNCDCNGCICKYCIDDKELTLSEIDSVYKQALDEGFVCNVISGGEPLLRQDLKDITHLSKSYGMYTVVVSNGWYLLDKHEFLNSSDLLFVYLNGIGDIHDRSMGNRFGLFDKAVNAVKFVKEKYPSVKICILSSLLEIPDTESVLKLVKLACELDVPIYFTVKNHNQNLKPNRRKLLEFFHYIKQLKEQGYPVYNSLAYINAILSGSTMIKSSLGRFLLMFSPDGDILKIKDKSCMQGLNLSNMTVKEVVDSQKFIESADFDLDFQENYDFVLSNLCSLKLDSIISFLKMIFI